MVDSDKQRDNQDADESRRLDGCRYRNGPQVLSLNRGGQVSPWDFTVPPGRSRGT